MARSYAIKGLQDLDRRLRRTAAGAINAADQILADETQRNAPVETGELAGKVKVLPARVGDRSASGAVLIDDSKGVHVEYGTEDMDPRPFFRPAIAAKRDLMRRKLVSKLKHL